ncbi:hypothetical protein [Halapricum hydrolyticum]|uniref:Uncharacterized protein n=1 Tax=Halapricum hydrolyticum TaxID=2979991 RepID=A0AAE3LGE8_9EURY|nr:hypothetical protein [Halapricum hydrolyticum]MCU4719682.1 hypothetical protein [Halapricum hydrolyticum]MCU4728612.1 hypothetical protein [Halapricum hydrolyticum]
MDLNSLRADGWEDIVALSVMVVVAMFFWYMRDMYLNWTVFVAGIGAGVGVYFINEFAEDYPVAGFPISMMFVIVMLVALYEESLVAGVVAALITTTAIKVYEVYL